MLTLNYSVMGAGKSARLLQAVHEFEEGGARVLLFTSALDDRAGVGRIASRMGISRSAHPVAADDDLFNLVAAAAEGAPITAIFIDEVQFLRVHHAEQMIRISDELGIEVLAYGLKNNVFGHLFSDTIAFLLAKADRLVEIARRCHCGQRATQILRYDPEGQAIKSGNVVEVGGDDRYVSVCRPHWNAGDIGPILRAGLFGQSSAA